MSIKTYRLPEQAVPVSAARRVVALGLFDGLHIGHRAVIAAAAGIGGGRCAVYTFRPETVDTKEGLFCLSDESEQRAILESMGVGELFEVDFSAVRQLTPTEFVRRVLVGELGVRAVVCGFNYRFGRGGAGDTALLAQLCREQNIALTVVPEVNADGEPVSSTRIRRAVAEGDMALTSRLLNRGFCLRLPVEPGQHLGHKLGVPTVNQRLPENFVRPRFGVYASCVTVDGHTYTGVTNIGVRPTVGSDAPLAETWICGYDGDLYGRTLEVYPVRFLRPERKFDSLEELQAQIRQDEQDAQAVFADRARRAVLFDFDDTLSRRNQAFDVAAERLIQRCYPGLSPDELSRRTAEMVAFNNHGYMPLTYPQFVEKFLTRWEGARCGTPEQELMQLWTDFADHVAILPEAATVLRQLRTWGWLVGVITNGRSFLQNRKLDMSGLRPLLDVVTVSGDEGVHKPDPELFRRVAARLGVSCERCVYVGDHPVNDVQGSLSAGMHPVYIQLDEQPTAPGKVPDGVPELHGLSALPGLAEALVPAGNPGKRKMNR